MTWGNAGVGLWAVLGLAVFGAWVVVLCRQRRRRLRRLAGAEAWPLLVPEETGYRNRIRLGLRLAALVFLAAGLAQPRWGTYEEAVEKQGLDVVIALDVSRSMWAEDVKPNRLRQAQWGVRELLPHMGGDRLGLVVFAGDAVVLCPLTNDRDAFRMLLDDARPELVSRGGTNLHNGLKTAIDMLGPPVDADRAIVLISDGENHEGDPLALLETLRKQEIRVYAVGIGDPEGAVIPIPEGRPRAGELLRDRDGHVVLTRLNEVLLQRLAYETGGAYVRATPADFGVDRLYREAMVDLRRAQHETRFFRMLRERFQWFVGAGLICLVWELWRYAGRKRRFLPVRAARGAGVLLWAFGFVAVPLAEASEAHRHMASGLRTYEQKAWDDAAEAFTRAAELAPDAGLDPAYARYNAGLAFQKAGRPAEAADAFAAGAETLGARARMPAYHQRGRALAREAEASADAREYSVARERLEQALQAYAEAIRLSPSPRYLKRDYERARERLAEIEEMIPPEPAPDRDREPDAEPEPDEAPPEPDPAPDTRDEADEDEAEPGDASEPEPGEGEPSPADTPVPEEMTLDDAERILDALREEEAAHREGIRPSVDPAPVEKDW